MLGQQGLVGRDHMLAGGQRLQHQLLGDAVAADSSTTISISGLASTSRASPTTLTPEPTICCARAVSRSATMVISMPRPARRLISSWLRCSTLKVPLPTVPMPNRPTWIAFISGLPVKKGPSALLTGASSYQK